MDGYPIAQQLESSLQLMIVSYGRGSRFEVAADKFSKALELPLFRSSVAAPTRSQMNSDKIVLADIITQEAFVIALNQYLAEFARADRKRKQEMLKVFANVDWEKIHQGKAKKSFFDGLTNFFALQQPRAVLGKETLDLVCTLSQVPAVQNVFKMVGDYAKLSLMAQAVYEQQEDSLRKTGEEDLQPHLNKILSQFEKAEAERVKAYREMIGSLTKLEELVKSVRFEFDPENEQSGGMADRVQATEVIGREQQIMVANTLQAAELLEAEQIAMLRVLLKSKTVEMHLKKALIAQHLFGTLDRLVMTLLSYVQNGFQLAHALYMQALANEANNVAYAIETMAKSRFAEIGRQVTTISLNNEALLEELNKTV